MTTFGPITLTRYNVYSLSKRDAALSGYFTSALKRDELRELCDKCEASEAIDLLDGSVEAVDLSEDQKNIVYCLFDEDQYLDGFYLITGYQYSPRTGYLNYYPFAVTILLLGSNAVWQRAYELVDLEELTNDWGL